VSSRKSRIGDPTAQRLIAEFGAAIPKNEQVVRRALRDALLPYEGDVEQIKANISKVITHAEQHAHNMYKFAQWPALSRAIKIVFGAQISSSMSASEAIELVAKHVEGLDRFFLSVSQGRKARAGTAVETFFDTLFRDLRYPFEREHVINGTPDFVFPNVKHFHDLPTDCIIFTSKRTLRERWRQITSEGSRGFLLFLATLDTKIKAADLQQIKKQKIYVVVPRDIQTSVYAGFPHVISIESFLRDHLDPAMERWRRNDVIAKDC